MILCFFVIFLSSSVPYHSLLSSSVPSSSGLYHSNVAKLAEHKVTQEKKDPLNNRSPSAYSYHTDQYHLAPYHPDLWRTLEIGGHTPKFETCDYQHLDHSSPGECVYVYYTDLKLTSHDIIRFVTKRASEPDPHLPSIKGLHFDGNNLDDSCIDELATLFNWITNLSIVGRDNKFTLQGIDRLATLLTYSKIQSQNPGLLTLKTGSHEAEFKDVKSYPIPIAGEFRQY